MTKKTTFPIDEFKKLNGIKTDQELASMIINRNGKNPSRQAIGQAKKAGMHIRQNGLGECFIIEPYYARAFL